MPLLPLAIRCSMAEKQHKVYNAHAYIIGVGTGEARGAIAPPIFWEGGQSPP